MGYHCGGFSADGFRHAQEAHPNLNLVTGSAYDDLAGHYVCSPAALNLEVPEHVFAPRDWARTLNALLERGGAAIVSRPFHGSWEYLALALSGRMDAHFTALWDHDYIEFWSVQTLTELSEDTGFVDSQVSSVC